MKIKLFEKNGSVKNSSVYLGYLILKKLAHNKKEKKISIFQVTRMAKEFNPTCNAKQIIYALMFLHATNLIEYKKPFIKILYAETN